MTHEQISLLAYILGVLASIIVPYLVEYVKRPQPFDWRYVLGRLLASGTFLFLYLTVDGINAISAMHPWAAFAAGFVVSQVGRMADKLATPKPTQEPDIQ